MATEMVTGNANTMCDLYCSNKVRFFIPLHINCFPAEREEEANSGTASKNFVNISLQHPVGGEKEKNILN